MYASKMEEGALRRVGGVRIVGVEGGGDGVGIVWVVDLRGLPSVWYV